MSNKVTNALLLATISAVAACSGIKETIGIHSNAPDEFRVVSNAPLVVPPEFHLRPPSPGAKRPQELDLQQQAKDTLLEGSVKKQKDSVETKAEDAFLKKAAAGESNSEIKEVLINEEQEAAKSQKKKGFFEKAATYTNLNKPKKDPVVNSKKEKERLEENKKEGKPANDGETATTEEGNKPLLNNVFGF